MKEQTIQLIKLAFYMTFPTVTMYCFTREVFDLQPVESILTIKGRQEELDFLDGRQRDASEILSLGNSSMFPSTQPQTHPMEQQNRKG